MAIPINMLPSGTTRAIHLRKASSSGGKDWIGCLSTAFSNLKVIFGKTAYVLDGRGSSKFVKDPATNHALEEYARKKKDEGYYLVDEYDQGRGWDSQLTQSGVQPQPSPQPEPPDSPLRQDPVDCNSTLFVTDGVEDDARDVWIW